MKDDTIQYLSFCFTRVKQNTDTPFSPSLSPTPSKKIFQEISLELLEYLTYYLEKRYNKEEKKPTKNTKTDLFREPESMGII